MGKSTLSYINENLKTYYFACSLLASLASISGMFMNFKSFMAWLGTILILGLFFFSTKFLVVGHNSKQTKHERALIYKEGYEQGKFDENADRTYTWKYSQIDKITQLQTMIKDIEYQVQQAAPHPALLGILATVNSFKKVLNTK